MRLEGLDLTDLCDDDLGGPYGADVPIMSGDSSGAAACDDYSPTQEFRPEMVQSFSRSAREAQEAGGAATSNSGNNSPDARAAAEGGPARLDRAAVAEAVRGRMVRRGLEGEKGKRSSSVGAALNDLTMVNTSRVGSAGKGETGARVTLTILWFNLSPRAVYLKLENFKRQTKGCFLADVVFRSPIRLALQTHPPLVSSVATPRPT